MAAQTPRPKEAVSARGPSGRNPRTGCYPGTARTCRSEAALGPGMLLIPPQQVTLDVGQRIDVHMTEEGAAPHGNKWVPAFPLPRSSRPSVLIRSAISSDRATATYRSVRPGHAVLMSSRTFCLHTSHHRDRETTAGCPVVEVTIIP